jgi:hypothetical protein
MFEYLQPSQSDLIAQNIRQAAGHSRLAGQALRLFNSALRNGRLANLWSRISGRSNGLLDLDGLAHHLNVRGRHYAGVQAVAIDLISGSEGRVHDFDNAFHPLSENTRQRWLSVATARLEGVALPAVELIQIGERYFVRDGHHRISVAYALGETAIDAQVTVWDVRGSLPWETAQPAQLGIQAA